MTNMVKKKSFKENKHLFHRLIEDNNNEIHLFSVAENIIFREKSMF